MANLTLDTEAVPSTPSSGFTLVFVDSTSKQLATKDDSGKVVTITPICNANTANDTSASGNADAYLSSSKLTVPPQLVRVGTIFRWRFVITKTGAGTATPVWKVWVGTNGSTSDTARLTFTGAAQTANSDQAQVDLVVVVQTAGASGVIEGTFTLYHSNAGTGFDGTNQINIIQSASSAFDLTVANSIFGVSVNPGASGVWTHTLITGHMENI